MFKMRDIKRKFTNNHLERHSDFAIYTQTQNIDKILRAI